MTWTIWIGYVCLYLLAGEWKSYRSSCICISGDHIACPIWSRLESHNMGIELVLFLASYQVVSWNTFLQTTHKYLYIKKKDAISPTENCIITLICPAPPQAAGGCASVSEQIPERGGLCAGPPAGGCANVSEQIPVDFNRSQKIGPISGRLIK